MATENPKPKIICQIVDSVGFDKTGGIFYGKNPLESNFCLFMLQITMIIFITRILMILLKPLKQPRIVSEIIAGIIIGPSILGRNEKFMELMFPEKGRLLLNTVADMSIMYFAFVIGVQMDTSMIGKAGKKAYVIGFWGMTLPFILVYLSTFFLRKYLQNRIVHGNIWLIVSTFAITSSKAIYLILKEFNILNSKISRLAITIAMISEIAIWILLFIFGSIGQFSHGHRSSVWLNLCSLMLLISLVVFVFRPLVMWIIIRTPVGNPVDRFSVIAILLVVLVSGFIGDAIGTGNIDGPLMLGLAIPDGPPLGSTIVKRSETIIMDLFMPVIYMVAGLETDVFSLSDWVALCSQFFIILIGYLGKLFGILLPSLYFSMTFIESLSLSLMLNLRGQIEIFSFYHWRRDEVVSAQFCALSMLATTMLTVITAVLIRTIYRPTSDYISGNQKRNVQHSRLDCEIRIVACIHEQESIPGLINFLQASHSNKESPISVYALHLVELNGANAMFITHDSLLRSSKYARSNFMVKALKIYEQTHNHYGSIQAFTAVSPYNTMYRDICELALEKKASLIIVPFHKPGWSDYNQYNASHMVNSSLLAHAPCSVGILVDRNPHMNILPRSLASSMNHVAVIFMGGADSREALAYADFIARKPSTSLTVVQFLLADNIDDYDDEKERKLDDEFVEQFMMKHYGNDQVVYQEVIVKDGAETIKAIHAMKNEMYDLWIMGRQQGMNSKLIEGISDWSDENPELGVIGDFVCSPDFGCASHVFVVQQ